MLAELRDKSQITLPKSMLSELGLNKGDMLEITVKDGGIYITPVAVYPKKYIEQLRREAEDTIAKIHAGEQPTFGSMEALIAKLREAA